MAVSCFSKMWIGFIEESYTLMLLYGESKCVDKIQNGCKGIAVNSIIPI